MTGLDQEVFHSQTLNGIYLFRREDFVVRVFVPESIPVADTHEVVKQYLSEEFTGSTHVTRLPSGR